MTARVPTVGLIVPPADGRVPDDGPLLYQGRVRFLARGLGIGAVAPDGFNPVIDGVLEHARELRRAGADIISLMGTSISFYRGAGFTETLRAAMAEVTGVPCTTMSHAIVRALRQLGIRRVAIATSYIDELNERLVEYLAGSGFTVTALESLPMTGIDEIRQVSTGTLVALASRAWERSPGADGIFISCGGLLTLEAIRRLEDRFGVPVTASSPAGFWDVVRLAGADPCSPGHGRLFERTEPPAS
ncbi:MAG TPA: aspartate/glutamate racemase family protein [Ramlibacter sp.]|jgi:arylmalonate decarboxylase|uniref:arylmalonate decarboxylase n=1 Tax=Ramlibacter sp. TaxID=1917967 RepID=UPI002D573551|nr:aspartate/glutamate racemase family protein [Ramlibacter sp.]HZY17883.1 aspartate/glutamate racemase family protein [Ramlibacter sp.]